MKRSISFAVLALGLSLFLVLACQGDTQKWYGDWEGNLNRVDPVDDVARSINRATLTIKPDGTFLLIRSGISNSGTHSLSGDRAYLHITKYMDRQIDQIGPAAEKMNKEITVKWQEDGTILLVDPGEFSIEPVVFTRKEPESSGNPSK